MSHRVWRALCASVLAAGVMVLGAAGLALGAQRVLDGQLVVKSNGSIYLIQNGMRYLVTPIPLSDTEIDGIPDGGTVERVQGANTQSAVFDPAAGDAATAADLIMGRYWAYGQWESAYALLHPSHQAVLPRNIFVDTMRAWRSTFQITAVQPGAVEQIGDWTDPGTGKSFSGVVKVPVTMTLLRGGESISANYDLYMVKVGDYYRWFWAPPTG